MNRMLTIKARWFFPLIALALLPNWLLAQGVEVEPNNPCAAAQNFGDTGLPYDVSGNLDLNDVDFFRFNAIAGEEVVADLEGSATGQGTLGDPYLGLFDSNCNLLAINDDSGTLNSRLYFTVPADGVFVLAASGFCDYNFDGSHGYTGTYTLTIAQAPQLSTVSGRVVDAALGDPLPGAWVNLLECLDATCTMYNYVSGEVTDSLGEFLFYQTYWGTPLMPGTYRVTANAADYQQGYSDVFELLEGQDLDIGDIELTGPPLRFTDIVPCTYLPAVGGECEYSVRITNTEPAPLRGAAWSQVTASGTGSYIGYTDFPAGGLERLRLDPGASAEVEFSFNVPGTVPQGTYICPDAWVGLGLREPYFFTVGVKDPLFCVAKGATSFTMITGDEAERIARQLDAQRSPKHPGAVK
jgi:hypothetical protein